jgi:hypothetical protein
MDIVSELSVMGVLVWKGGEIFAIVTPFVFCWNDENDGTFTGNIRFVGD